MISAKKENIDMGYKEPENETYEKGPEVNGRAVFQVEGRAIPEVLVCVSLVCTRNNEAEYARGGAVTQSQVMEGLPGHYKDFR